MAEITSGVRGYVNAEATVANQFPIDLRGNAHVCCDYCWYYSKSANLCHLTKEYCYDSAHYVNGSCPFLNYIIESENDKETKNNEGENK